MYRFERLAEEQHAVLGRDLKEIRRRAMNVRSELWPHFSKSYTAFKKLQRIIDLSIEISSKLELYMYSQDNVTGRRTMYFNEDSLESEK